MVWFLRVLWVEDVGWFEALMEGQCSKGALRKLQPNG